MSDFSTKTLIVGHKGRMGNMLMQKATAHNLPVIGIDQPLELNKVKEKCDDRDLIIICVPASVIKNVLKTICPYLKKTAIIADITSVKELPIAQMEKIWNGPIIGTHPLFGPNVQDNDEKPVAIIKSKKSTKAHLNIVEQFFIQIGCKTFYTTATEHDKAVALIQGMNFITNLAYFALLANQKEIMPFLTPSFKRRLDAAKKTLTEDAQLFTGLFEANPYSHEAVRKYRKMLNIAASGDLDLLCQQAKWWWEKA